MRKSKSRIGLIKSGGSYERGKKVGQSFKISALEVWTLRTDDDVAQLKSWPFDEICADVAKTFDQLTIANTKTNTPTSSPTSA
ncbi:MAG: hypothetical protein L3J52_02020 [Proteobacteria bacterium]|nr:hypothetical protein [Pseudomonadota bacterium]